jgi:hypothetical protein
LTRLCIWWWYFLTTGLKLTTSCLNLLYRVLSQKVLAVVYTERAKEVAPSGVLCLQPARRSWSSIAPYIASASRGPRSFVKGPATSDEQRTHSISKVRARRKLVWALNRIAECSFRLDRELQKTKAPSSNKVIERAIFQLTPQRPNPPSIFLENFQEIPHIYFTRSNHIFCVRTSS